MNIGIKILSLLNSQRESKLGNGRSIRERLLDDVFYSQLQPDEIDKIGTEVALLTSKLLENEEILDLDLEFLWKDN